MSYAKQAVMGVLGGLAVAAVIIGSIVMWTGSMAQGDWKGVTQAIVNKGLAVEYIDLPSTVYRKDTYWFTGISDEGLVKGTASRKLNSKGQEVWEVEFRTVNN